MIDPMRLIYPVFIQIYGLTLRLAAILGNKKAAAWLNGRKEWQKKLQAIAGQQQRWIWFHCASLGEFEQGRPLLESLHTRFPDHKFLLSFFSPSGYEVRKNYPGADAVIYLPLDTLSNARDFITILNPEMVFFIKYEFWFNFIRTLNERTIPLYFVSCIFRENQWLFSYFGKPLLKQLQKARCIFVQDESSLGLLQNAGFENCSVSGDTRFDRVISIAAEVKPLPYLESWRAASDLIVAGSTWSKDEELLLDFIRTTQHDLKLILVPHLVDSDHIDQLKKTLRKKGLEQATAFSSATSKQLKENARIFIVDEIGMLSKLYIHATMAYIGGGFGAGIHNTLEAAVYGKPLVFGPTYAKFKEAQDLIRIGAAFSISSNKSFERVVHRLLSDKAEIERCGVKAREYVIEHSGATHRILKKL
jgi:3-deoxy-D-manno-octulosonic-acid transferase